MNNSKPFQVSLFPVGGGQHYTRIKAKVRQETSIRTGDRVQVRFTVLDRANLVFPEDLMNALAAEGMTAALKSLPFGKQSFIIRRIDAAAKPETRKKGVQEAIVAAHQGSEMVAVVRSL